MNNLQYSAGERNRYFYGKLMTARDFEDEQTYFNDKRRLGNRMLHGTGIVAGLGVLLVDNQTFSLEAGMALDYLGREIVVQDPCVKRISAIRGFDQIQESGDVYLGIAYREELCEGTFSVAGSGEGSGVNQEFNRVQEGYELFLTTREPNRAQLGVDSVLYDLCRLYDEGGIRITLQIPRYVNTDDCFTVRVLFEKRDVSAPVRFSFHLESDMFRGPNGEKFVQVEYVETEVSTHKELTLEYTMDCGPVRDDYTQIAVPAESFSLSLGSKQAEGLEKSFSKAVEVTVRPLREVVVDAYYTRHFDELLNAKEDQAIYLAKFHIVSGQSAFFIEKVTRNPFRQYLPNTQLLDLLQTLDRSAGRAEAGQWAARAEEEKRPEAVPAAGRPVASGVETVVLGVAPKVGRSYFSHEFIHGLGAGSLCVSVAVENAENTGRNDTLVFGDGIFTADEFSLAAPACAVGAMVNVKKGTLQLGLKLLEKTGQQSIRLRWWAWRNEEEQPEKEELADAVQVIITPNTANLEPLQQIRFTAMVEGSASQEVNWSVVEKNGGSIDRNGLYTAPPTEGVFEIRAQSAKYGNYKASAYVVVSKL